MAFQTEPPIELTFSCLEGRPPQNGNAAGESMNESSEPYPALPNSVESPTTICTEFSIEMIETTRRVVVQRVVGKTNVAIFQDTSPANRSDVVRHLKSAMGGLLDQYC